MFPLQSEDDEILFKDPLFLEQGIKNMEDLFSDNAPLMEGNEVISSKGDSKKRKRDYEVDNESKKVMHRDVERHRRQEMAGLYTLLRSLLPPEYIKGKRSISNQMQGAVNYITYMHKNIKELQMKRDNLMKFYSSSRKSKISNSSNNSSSYVTVNPCRDGVMELLISCPNQQNLRLSAVLLELLGRGLHALCSDSTTLNGKSLHRIQIQANYDETALDLSELQDKLTSVINLS